MQSRFAFEGFVLFGHTQWRPLVALAGIPPVSAQGPVGSGGLTCVVEAGQCPPAALSAPDFIYDWGLTRARQELRVRPSALVSLADGPGGVPKSPT